VFCVGVSNRSSQSRASLAADPLATTMRAPTGCQGCSASNGTFRDGGDNHLGVSCERETWPRGRTGRAVPHGSVFVQ